MITPEDILALAERLATSAKASEAARRSAASRAYYSVFHMIGLELCPPNYFEPPNSHFTVRTALLSEDPATCGDHIRIAKRHFDTLKEARERSDYLLGEDVHDWEIELWLQQAKSIFAAKP